MLVPAPLHPFIPVGEETRPVDANGFCPECHNVATAWGKLLDKQRDRCVELEYALNQIASGPRPDGTYNISREVCQKVAREALEG